MKKEDLRIVFLGTPEFAVSSLKSLNEAGYNVVGVITAPDRKGGRGMKEVLESDVKKYASKEGMYVMQPKNLKNAEFLTELAALKANLQIVVAFRMLPVAVWDMPSLGTYNLHGSLLPKYRGAAPINWAIMNGEDYTGVTTFKLKHEIDTGSIALQAKLEIKKSDYLNDIHDSMMERGASLIVETIDSICAGTIELKEQDESGITKAPKIFHKDCELDLTKRPEGLYNHIRGLSPYPVAWTTLKEKKLKVYKALYTYHQHGLADGTFISDGKSYLAVTCAQGLLLLTVVQAEGKRRMGIKDYLNGINLKENKQQLPIRILPHWSQM